MGDVLATKVARVDQLLTNLAIDYSNSALGFVAEQIMPSFTVLKESGVYFKYEKGDLRHEDTSRSPGAPAKITSWGLTQVAYGPLQSEALKTQVTDEIGRQMGQTLAEKAATKKLVEKMMIARERKLATIMTNTSIMTQYTTLSGTGQWSDYDNSAPITDIEVAKTAVLTGCLKPANTLMLSYPAFVKLQNHPELVGRVNGLKDSITIEQMKSIFGIENIIVASSQYNTARQNAADSMAFIWGKHAWVGYVNPGANEELDSITFGHTLRLEGVDAGVGRTKVTKWRSEGDDEESTWVRAAMTMEHKVMAAEAMYFIQNAVA